MIAILGDTHMPRGARKLPAACVEILRLAELIVHTGDLVKLSVLTELERLAPVACVQGNMDEPEGKRSLPEILVVDQDGFRIGIVHDAGRQEGRHPRLLALFPNCDLIAYGHSHQPEIVRYGECWIVNPGSPTERRRASAHTMAVVERGRPRLIEL